MTEVDQVMGEKRVVTDGWERRGQNCAVRPEQKSVRWMRDLVAGLSKGGPLVLDLCDGIFSVENICMILQKHWRLVGCKIDDMCSNVSQTSVIKTFVQQVLNEDKDIDERAKLLAAERTYVSVIGGSMRGESGWFWMLLRDCLRGSHFRSMLGHSWQTVSKARELLGQEACDCGGAVGKKTGGHIGRKCRRCRLWSVEC